TETQKTFTGLDAAKKYNFAVIAVDNAGNHIKTKDFAAPEQWNGLDTSECYHNNEGKTECKGEAPTTTIEPGESEEPGTTPGYFDDIPVETPTDTQQPSATPDIEPAPREAGVVDMAIVLDDAGGSFSIDKAGIDIMKTAGAPAITFAIFPQSSATTQTAGYIASNYPKNSFNIILHQPMEYLSSPENCDKEYTQRTRICDRDTPEHAISILEKHMNQFSSFANFVGYNNHQGSRVTGNKVLMQAIAEFMKSNYPGYIVLDSNTGTAAEPSVAYQVMKENGVISYINVQFLDNTETVEYTKARLNELENKALSTGFAAGIGHLSRQTTPQAIADYVRGFTKEGDYLVKQVGNKKVRLVTISDLPK
ncbi:MAG: divergent polysaccharide deacetylase family protein, partial [Nanoarchaeota archaeon]|nr:divergent polysaccharide deacetylase family protein [Nanoarchaeota archaeon]